jgi:hypothetical protein
MSLIDCPQCGLPAQIVDRFALNGTSGPVEHVKMRCVAGHVLTPLVEHLERRGPRLLDGAATTLERLTEATEGGGSPCR